MRHFKIEVYLEPSNRAEPIDYMLKIIRNNLINVTHIDVYQMHISRKRIDAAK